MPKMAITNQLDMANHKVYVLAIYGNQHGIEAEEWHEGSLGYKIITNISPDRFNARGKGEIFPTDGDAHRWAKRLRPLYNNKV